MKYAFLLSLLLLATGLTGCVESDWSVNITHTGTDVIPDESFGCGDDDTECHAVSVSVEVTGSEDFESNMFYWEAVGSSGGMYDTALTGVSGPDACAAGATCNFVVHFEVANGDTLVTLNYDDIWNSASTSL